MNTSISGTVENNITYIFSLKPNVSNLSMPVLIVIACGCQFAALLAAMRLDRYGGRPLPIVAGGAVMAVGVASAVPATVPAFVVACLYGIGHGFVESATRSSLALLVPPQAIPFLLAMQGVMGSVLNMLLPALYGVLEVKRRGLGTVCMACLFAVMTVWFACVSGYNFMWGRCVLFGTTKFHEKLTSERCPKVGN